MQMQRRDNEMDDASLQLMELRVEVKKRQEGLKEKQVTFFFLYNCFCNKI